MAYDYLLEELRQAKLILIIPRHTIVTHQRKGEDQDLAFVRGIR